MVVQSVAAGEQFSLVLLEDGRLFSFGSNGAGQLGVGGWEHPDGRELHSTDVPQEVKELRRKGVRHVCAGQRYAAALVDETYAGATEFVPPDEFEPTAASGDLSAAGMAEVPTQRVLRITSADGDRPAILPGGGSPEDAVPPTRGGGGGAGAQDTLERPGALSPPPSPSPPPRPDLPRVPPEGVSHEAPYVLSRPPKPADAHGHYFSGDAAPADDAPSVDPSIVSDSTFPRNDAPPTSRNAASSASAASAASAAAAAAAAGSMRASQVASTAAAAGFSPTAASAAQKAMEAMEAFAPTDTGATATASSAAAAAKSFRTFHMPSSATAAASASASASAFASASASAHRLLSSSATVSSVTPPPASTASTASTASSARDAKDATDARAARAAALAAAAARLTVAGDTVGPSGAALAASVSGASATAGAAAAGVSLAGLGQNEGANGGANSGGSNLDMTNARRSPSERKSRFGLLERRSTSRVGALLRDGDSYNKLGFRVDGPRRNGDGAHVAFSLREVEGPLEPCGCVTEDCPCRNLTAPPPTPGRASCPPSPPPLAEGALDPCGVEATARRSKGDEGDAAATHDGEDARGGDKGGARAATDDRADRAFDTFADGGRELSTTLVSMRPKPERQQPDVGSQASVPLPAAAAAAAAAPQQLDQFDAFADDGGRERSTEQIALVEMR